MSGKQILTTFLLDQDDSFRETWAEFVAGINDELVKTPPEFRDKVEIELEFERGSGGDYGSDGSVRLMVFWQREETDDEFQTRTANEKAAMEAERKRMIAHSERAERSELSRLLKKYGVTP